MKSALLVAVVIGCSVPAFAQHLPQPTRDFDTTPPVTTCLELWGIDASVSVDGWTFAGTAPDSRVLTAWVDKPAVPDPAWGHIGKLCVMWRKKAPKVIGLECQEIESDFGNPAGLTMQPGGGAIALAKMQLSTCVAMCAFTLPRQ